MRKYVSLGWLIQSSEVLYECKLDLYEKLMSIKFNELGEPTASYK